jgi:hypothetical protein
MIFKVTLEMIYKQNPEDQVHFLNRSHSKSAGFWLPNLCELLKRFVAHLLGIEAFTLQNVH